MSTKRLDTETHCHCGAEYRGSDHCPECGCEQYESGDCGHEHTLSGAEAQRGDIVRNLTTGRTGRVIVSSQFGRIIVELSVSTEITETRIGIARQVWERFNSQVILKGDKS